MRIVIAGPGSLGCLLAARLSSVLRPEDNVLLLDHHRERARQLNQSGFTLEQQGKISRYLVQATANPRQVNGCDLFLLCTRSQAVKATLARSISLLSPETLLVAFQRGIREIAPGQTSALIARALAGCDVFQEDHGHFRCLDPGTFIIGLCRESPEDKRELDSVVTLFNRAGLKTEKSGNIRTKVWESFLQDLAINGLAAIYRRPYGQLLTSCSVRGNLKKVLKEAMAVAKAQGITISGDPIRTAFHTLRTDTKKIAPMFRDIQNKRVTEIDALNGALVKLGKQLSIPTPINEDLVLRVKKLEEHYRTC